MQESCPCGSVRGASGNRRPYRDTAGFENRWGEPRSETVKLRHCLNSSVLDVC